jgi:predicted ArsR family transcriptional regulator
METLRTGPAGETIDTPRHRALGSASRVAILRLVRDTESGRVAGLTAGEVAGRTRLHFSTVRAHLDRLVEAGLLIKARASGGAPGRPAWRYRAAAPEPAPAPYRALAAALLENLATTGGGAPAAVQAGEVWGRQLAVTGPAADAPPATGAPDPVATVLSVLAGLGFDPDRQPTATPRPDATGLGTHRGTHRGTATGAEVHLRTCPFLELVGQHPDVMCGLHAGVIRGALHAAGAPDGEAVLEPFGAPNACVARLRIPAPAGGRR